MKRYLISGGGTGGHIFPAVSIAQEIQQRDPQAEILFVGAIGRMEMEKIPALGYTIIGLPIAGIQRKLSISNLFLPFKVLKSLWLAVQILTKYKPHVVIGVGGYASFPVLFAAGLLRYPVLIQEQNSYAGVSNKFISFVAKKICVAYEGMDRFFPKNKIILTGNPIRKGLNRLFNAKDEAIKHFGISGTKPVILITGGSLGARTLNNSFLKNLEYIKNQNVDILWQTGKLYYDEVRRKVEESESSNILVLDFICRMDLAFGIADVIVSRAGAGTISELCIVGKPVILIPSPNVAEDHQTMNALALVKKNAALMVADKEATNSLVSETLGLLADAKRCELLASNIKMLSLPNASATIVDEIEKLLKIKE